MTTAANRYSEAEVNAFLDQLLATSMFAHAERQRRLLRYLVTQTLAGTARQLKGYTIAVDVFDRPPDFDSALDSIVRVQAAHLRAKLREYYDGDGRDDALRFELPKGAYVIHFEGRQIPLPPSFSSKGGNGGILNKGGATPREDDSGRAAFIDDRPSLAVLPFTNMSSDPEQEYFADGITEDLTADLSKISGLFVVARHSSFVYKGVAKRVQEIGRELGVRYLLEGSVRRSMNHVRITAQLIDSESGAHLWAERFDREVHEIFALQDEVNRSIVGALRLRLTSDDNLRLAQVGTENVEAFELCRRGNAAFVLWTPDALDWAQAFYERSITIDPSYAEPHAWLARVHTYRWITGLRTGREESLDTAFQLARRALELDEQLPMAHGTLCWVSTWAGSHDEAIAAGRRAVALDPGGAEVYYWLGVSLSYSGMTDEADRALTQAMQFNPHAPVYYLWARAQNYLFMERYQEAIDLGEKILQTSPTFLGGYTVLAASYALAGRIDEARRMGAELKRLFSHYCRLDQPRESIALRGELADRFCKALALAGI